MARFECTVCAFVYDESDHKNFSDQAEGKAFEGLPSTWKCPGCGVLKNLFIEIENKKVQPGRRIKTTPGWTFLGLLKNIFFLLLFLQVLPFLITGVKGSLDEMLHDKSEVGYMVMRGEIVDSGWYASQIQDLEESPDIRGLIIRIDSPGGFPGSSQAIFRELLAFKNKKPVVVLAENMCASGAYYVACAASKIITNPSTLVGSIGTVMRVPNVKELLDSWKIKNVCIQSGEFKTAADPFKELKNEDLDHLQGVSDDTYQQFVADVAAQRGLDLAQHEAWANGRVFTGAQAHALGLVDELGSYRDAVAAMAKILALTPADIRLVSVKKPMGGMLKFLSDDDEGLGVSTSVAARLGRFCADVYDSLMVSLAARKPVMAV